MSHQFQPDSLLTCQCYSLDYSLVYINETMPSLNCEIPKQSINFILTGDISFLGLRWLELMPLTFEGSSFLAGQRPMMRRR